MPIMDGSTAAKKIRLGQAGQQKKDINFTQLQTIKLEALYLGKYYPITRSRKVMRITQSA